MEKVQTKNKLKGFFGLFAAFALAIGVGVSLAPKEAVRTQAAETTISVATYASANSWSNGTKYPTIVSGAFTLAGTGGSNSTKYYSANPGTWRFYSSDSPKGNIVITGDATVAAITGVSTAGASTTWTYNGKTATMGALSANISISGFTITYTPAGASFGTLDKIEVANPADKLSFYVGDTFSSAGLTIKATDNSTPAVEEIVTSGFSTTPATGLVLTAAHKPSLTVNVSYTRNGVTKSTSYSVPVTDVPAVKTFKEVTSAADLYVGSTYVFSGVKETIPYTMSTNQGTNNRTSEATTYVNGDIKDTENTQKFELVNGLQTGEYAFKTINGTANKYIYAASSSANQLKSEDSITVNSSWKLTFSGGVLTAKAENSSNRNLLQFNLNNTNPPLFAAYSSAQAPVALHIDEETKPVSGFGTLDHIAVNSAAAKTTYYAGEKFTTIGLIVTAYDTKPEPESKVVVDFTTSILEDSVLSTLGEHTVTVTYIEGVSKSTTYKINVLRAQTYTKLATADDIRFGQMYALGSPDGAASTTVGTIAGEVLINYNEDDDSFTTVTNLQLVALRIGSVKGSYAIQLLNGPSVDKYYSWTTGNEIRVSAEINEASSWFIAFDEEVLTITHAADPTRFIGHNHGATRFAAYTGTTTPAASLYMDFGSYEVEQEAMTLAEAVNTGIGNNANKSCHAAYEFLSDVYSRLSVEGKAFFDTDEDYADVISARERMLYLAAWTAANSGTPDAKINSPVNDNNSLTATIIIGVIGLTTLAGYYFLQKKKEA